MGLRPVSVRAVPAAIDKLRFVHEVVEGSAGPPVAGGGNRRRIDRSMGGAAPSWTGGRDELPVKQDEPVGKAVRRIARKQSQSARKALADPSDARESVHDARTGVKKLRALLRLVQPALGEKRYGREDRKLRKLGKNCPRCGTPRWSSTPSTVFSGGPRAR